MFVWQGKSFLHASLFVSSGWSELSENVIYKVYIHHFHNFDTFFHCYGGATKSSMGRQQMFHREKWNIKKFRSKHESCSIINLFLKVCNIYRNTPVLESLFSKVVGFQVCNFIKKRLYGRCFPVSIAKFLRAPILKITYFCKLTIHFLEPLLD